MNNLEKMTEMLQNNPELEELIASAAKKLAESGQAAGAQEAIAGALKSVLDLDLTDVDLEVFAEEMNEQDSEQA